MAWQILGKLDLRPQLGVSQIQLLAPGQTQILEKQDLRPQLGLSSSSPWRLERSGKLSGEPRSCPGEDSEPELDLESLAGGSSLHFSIVWASLACPGSPSRRISFNFLKRKQIKKIKKIKKTEGILALGQSGQGSMAQTIEK